MIRTSQKIRMIKTADISPNPYQVRRNFDRKKIEELSLSIKEHGMLSPVIVRGAFDGFELICGQRRLRAAIMAGLKEIPAIIVRAGDAQCACLTLIENLHRDNLTFSEEAEGYYNLMAYHRIKREKLLSFLSLEWLKINNKVRILGLSERVRYKIEEKGYGETFARELLKLRDEEKQLEIIERAKKEDWSLAAFSKAIKEELKEMAQKRIWGSKTFKEKSIEEKMPVYINTIKKTVDLLNKNGANAELSEKENEEYNEFCVKIYKK